MTEVSVKLCDRFVSQSEHSKPATTRNHQGVARLNLVEKPKVAVTNAATQAAELQESQAGISRHVDSYAKKRGLPPLIATFLNTHWRSYLVQSYLVDGEDSESWREGIKAMKDLVWSVRPKKDPLSRRRVIAMIPQLYQRLHVGLDSMGLSAAEHDAFFAELPKLHQAALNPQKSVAGVSLLRKM